MKRIKARVANKDTSKKVSFLKYLLEIILKRKYPEGAFTNKALSILVSTTFQFVSIFGSTFIIVALYLLYSGKAEEAIGEINILFKIFAIPFSLVGLLYMLIILQASNEIDKEKDRNYVVALFSGVTSFAALIVAIASLFVGVN